MALGVFSCSSSIWNGLFGALLADFTPFRSRHGCRNCKLRRIKVGLLFPCWSLSTLFLTWTLGKHEAHQGLSNSIAVR